MTVRWQRQCKQQRVDSSVRPEGLRPRISRLVPTAANAFGSAARRLARSERDRKGANAGAIHVAPVDREAASQLVFKRLRHITAGGV